jgi:hypothetical protein
MDTLNAFHVAPIGYARAYVTMEAHGCKRHAEYATFCPECDWVPVSHTVAMVDDVIALVLDWEDGSIVEWITADSGVEFATSIAHDGQVVIREDALNDPCDVIRALASEARLYADCFSVQLSELHPSILPVPALF